MVKGGVACSWQGIETLERALEIHTGLQADGKRDGAGGNHDAGNLEPVSSGGCGDGSGGHALPCSLVHCCKSHDDCAGELGMQKS